MTKQEDLTAGLVEKIKQRDLRNIAQKAQQGQPLTQPQLDRLAEYEAKDSSGRKMVQVEEGDISAGNLALILGKTERRIKQLHSENVISKNGRNRYLFPQNIQEYIEWLKKHEGQAKTELQEQRLLLDIERKKEDIQRIRDEREERVEARVWQETMDCLAEYKSELDKIAEEIPDDMRQKLDKALTEACTRVRERYVEYCDAENEAIENL